LRHADGARRRDLVQEASDQVLHAALRLARASWSHVFLGVLDAHLLADAPEKGRRLVRSTHSPCSDIALEPRVGDALRGKAVCTSARILGKLLKPARKLLCAVGAKVAVNGVLRRPLRIRQEAGAWPARVQVPRSTVEAIVFDATGKAFLVVDASPRHRDLCVGKRTVSVEWRGRWKEDGFKSGTHQQPHRPQLWNLRTWWQPQMASQGGHHTQAKRRGVGLRVRSLRGT